MPKGCLIQTQPNHINNRYHTKFNKNTIALALAYIRENPSQSDLFRFVKSCHTLKQQTLECTNLQKQTQKQSCTG